MAYNIGNLGQIVQSFKESISQIFGGAGNNRTNVAEKGGSDIYLFNKDVGGSYGLDKTKWIGNAGTDKKKVKYGFATVTLSSIANGALNQISKPNSLKVENKYYLDIPPQSIQQKEIFANNIEATRKGVIVESEGVVFRDIVIQGTTGVFPGKRGDANVGQANLGNLTAPPSAPKGLDPRTGLSTQSNEQTISGYEEFLRLRQFFLAYAQNKVKNDGDLFLLFLNEKDNQTLIVEPMEFTMERNSKSPMTYNYRIVLKGIGDLNTAISAATNAGGSQASSFLEDIGNVSQNIQVAIQQGRAAFNQSIRLLTRISQSVDQTVNGPLRQVQFASEDMKDGVATVLSLPEILMRNTTSTIMATRENINQTGATVNDETQSNFRIPTSEESATGSANFVQQRDISNKINSDNRVPIPRSFMYETRDKMQEIEYSLADFVGLGDPLFNSIKGRVTTLTPDPLKQVSDEEFLLLGQLANVSATMNQGLAANVLFQSDAEASFEEASAPFQSDSIPESQQIKINKPVSVREITVQRNDTLERIAQREYGDALRWIDIVILNSLKPPYINAVRGDGVVQPGDKIMVGIG